MSFNASTAGLRVLRHILALPVTEAGHNLSKIAPYLTYTEDQKAFDFIRQHYATTGKLPHPDTVLDQVQVFLPESNETLSFEMDQLQGRFISDAMRGASDEASALLAQNDAKGALHVLLERLLPVTQEHGGYQVLDLRQGTGLDRYYEALSGEGPAKQSLGYPTLDAQGGIEDGDMIGVVGKPGAGKTWLMLYTALMFWSQMQEPVLFVTQEMSGAQIENRAYPMIAGVDPTPLYKGEPIQYVLGGPTQDEYLALLEGARADLQSSPVPFLIYDSKMAGTVSDIEAIASMHGIKRIWLDGAYMLRHPDARLGRYARVPENLDLLKQWCQRTGSACVTSWQFKRGSGKVTDTSEAPDLDDIGYSHAIGEYCGVILGLLEDPKSLEQIARKKVSVMKGRNGEQGSFWVHWNFANCDFSEVSMDESEAEGITYL